LQDPKTSYFIFWALVQGPETSGLAYILDSVAGSGSWLTTVLGCRDSWSSTPLGAELAQVDKGTVSQYYLVFVI
jgi:hypothetical protein